MFILHKNFTKWAAGCTKTFGEGVKEGREVIKEGNTDSGHSHWAGAKLREGGLRLGPTPYRMHLHAHSLPVNEEEKDLEVGARF